MVESHPFVSGLGWFSTINPWYNLILPFVLLSPSSISLRSCCRSGVLQDRAEQVEQTLACNQGSCPAHRKTCWSYVPCLYLLQYPVFSFEIFCFSSAFHDSFFFSASAGFNYIPNVYVGNKSLQLPLSVYTPRFCI